MALKTMLFTVLIAVIAGAGVGLGDVLGWAKHTPEAIGWYTFCAVIIGAQVGTYTSLWSRRRK